MKFKNVYKVAGILALYVLLQSRSGGPGGEQSLQVTGAPGSTGILNGQPGTCANIGCHVQGSFNPSLAMTLLDGSTTVEKYEAGKTYTLKMEFTAGTGTPARYGFQALALNASDAQAGDWGDPGQGNHVVTIANKKFVEHTAPKSSGTIEVPWVAPAAGTGAVTFYAAGIAANNNTNINGDGTANSTLEIEEATASSTNAGTRDFASILVAPNPVDANMYLQIVSPVAGRHTVRILNVSGIVEKEMTVNLTVGTNQVTAPIAELPVGLYLVQLAGEGQAVATRMLKK